ncbi:substrate-binding domain-containing protein [Akkermansiaceae bacterium]|nr:substrate-binding domain-containing protein [Akkermansiaceae bacterium]
MGNLRILSASQQVAEHLRSELLSGRWTGAMPGEDKLIAQLGAGRATVKAALRQLEDEGLLIPQGAGRRRRVVLPKVVTPAPSLRVALLNYEPLDDIPGYTTELMHLLVEAGHSAYFSGKSLSELRMDLGRIVRHMEETDADAWVVTSGSRELLEWLASGKTPAFAMFGRRGDLPMAAAGPDKPPAYVAVTRRLIELGHRRIVLIARKERRFPKPGASERAFLATLKANGIPTGTYNLPDWEENPEGFHELLRQLFERTPPTALFIDQAPFFFAVRQFLLSRSLRVPEDVSLVCADADPYFHWNKPSISHIRWDSRPVVRRIVRWADNVARGKADIRQSRTRAEFVEGGTIGPARR